MGHEKSTLHLRDDPPGSRPVVSAIMANYQGARHLAEALRSVAAQTLQRIEIIVSDDASTDDSVAIIRAMMSGDSRIRLITSERNRGPGGARNAALDAARGEWIAVVDADDVIHPERFERLLSAARQAEADIVADDLLFFGDAGDQTGLLLADGEVFDVGPCDWVRAGIAGTPALGYLKPMMRSACLAGLRYDETLRIGEDFDLVLRLLLRGARFRVVPEPWYLYRRHGGSISHRLSPATLEAMIAAHLRLVGSHGPFPPDVEAALRERLDRLRGGLAYEMLLAALKGGRMAGAIGMVCRNPALLGKLAGSAADRIRRERSSARGARPIDAGTYRPQALYLTEHAVSPAEVGLGEDDIVKTVPAYPPIGSAHGGSSGHRQLWAELAAISSAATSILYDGPAGRYAAGFIPWRAAGAPLGPAGRGREEAPIPAAAAEVGK